MDLTNVKYFLTSEMTIQQYIQERMKVQIIQEQEIRAGDEGDRSFRLILLQ